MSVRSSELAIWVCIGTAFLVGCADGGSSATHPVGAVPAAVQEATVPGALGSPARGVHSGVRRPLLTPTCLGVGTGSFLGINNSNVAGGYYTVVGGGMDNEACATYSSVVGGYSNIAAGSGDDGFIGGGESNELTAADSDSAVVAGNGNVVAGYESAIVDGESNSVYADHALTGGGRLNVVASNAEYGTIAGGYENNLSGEYGVIAGGLNNTVSGEGGYIAAGGYNTVSGEGAVIDGGFNSTAAGTFATIPGGYVNSAAGTYSFAAGARASAAQTGTFVWSDGSDGDTILTSAHAYQFLARASGGVTFWTNAASTVGATLAPGSGTWASASDRNLKTDVARIDDAAVLAKVAALPIERWSYKSERGVRHVGPMAQDFYAAFGVGEDDKHITSIDEDGVALAAIKALRVQNARLTALTATQSSQIAELSAEIASIRAEIRSRR